MPGPKPYIGPLWCPCGALWGLAGALCCPCVLSFPVPCGGPCRCLVVRCLVGCLEGCPKGVEGCGRVWKKSQQGSSQALSKHSVPLGCLGGALPVPLGCLEGPWGVPLGCPWGCPWGCLGVPFGVPWGALKGVEGGLKGDPKGEYPLTFFSVNYLDGRQMSHHCSDSLGVTNT